MVAQGLSGTLSTTSIVVSSFTCATVSASGDDLSFQKLQQQFPIYFSGLDVLSLAPAYPAGTVQSTIRNTVVILTTRLQSTLGHLVWTQKIELPWLYSYGSRRDNSPVPSPGSITFQIGITWTCTSGACIVFVTHILLEHKKLNVQQFYDPLRISHFLSED